MRIQSDYILNNPNAESCLETYAAASEELLIPFPATHIDDYARFDKLIGGMRPREFSIVCGATGVGKTTLMANLSKSWIKQKVPHFVASVETGRTDFLKRVMSALSGEDWNTGDPVPVEKLQKFHAKHGDHIQAESLWLSRYEDRFSVQQLMSDVAYFVVHKGAKIAIVDNLNFFLEVTSASNQVVEMDRVIHELIIFCKNVDVHLIMIMHPKKTLNGRVESEFDIKGSSTAVQESHNVFLFNRPDPKLIEAGYATKEDRELTIAKMRRKGRAVGSRLILKPVQGVRYEEGLVI